MTLWFIKLQSLSLHVTSHPIVWTNSSSLYKRWLHTRSLSPKDHKLIWSSFAEWFWNKGTKECWNWTSDRISTPSSKLQSIKIVNRPCKASSSILRLCRCSSHTWIINNLDIYLLKFCLYSFKSSIKII